MAFFRVKILAIYVVAGVLLAAGVVFVRSVSGRPPPTSGSRAVVDIPDVGYRAHVDTALTPEARGQGLSGRASLPDDGGMIFQFDALGWYYIWMRGMRFSIDLIWIAGGVVVDTHERLPVPEPNADPGTLPHFVSEPEALFLVEVPAGTVERYGIREGQRVQITFDR